MNAGEKRKRDPSYVEPFKTQIALKVQGLSSKPWAEILYERVFLYDAHKGKQYKYRLQTQGPAARCSSSLVYSF